MLGWVYKLCCKDPSIEEIYVGSSFNIKERMCGHKSDCNNPNRKKYNYKVYKFIRDNGGWTNWTYEILEEEEVVDKDELEICYEDSWILYLEPQLNCRRARRSKKEYYEDNKEIIAKIRKEYYEENKEQISKREKEKIQCECGSIYSRQNKARHEKTKKHIAFINNKKN